MIKAIVYKSNTGHTMQYAKMLGEKLNIPFYTIKQANENLKRNDEVIYLGWIFATKISGLNKVRNKYDIKCYGAVGVYPADNEYIETLKKTNNIDKPLFYMRGGIDYTKLEGLKRKVFQMVGKALEKENKEENKELVKMFKNGANFVSEENLKEILQYIKLNKE